MYTTRVRKKNIRFLPPCDGGFSPRALFGFLLYRFNISFLFQRSGKTHEIISFYSDLLFILLLVLSRVPVTVIDFPRKPTRREKYLNYISSLNI